MHDQVSKDVALAQLPPPVLNDSDFDPPASSAATVKSARAVGFREWWNGGYRGLVPIVPPGAKGLGGKELGGSGKMPGTRTPSGEWCGMADWQIHDATEADLNEWQKMGAGVGLRLDDAFFVDIDVTDVAASEKVVEIALATMGPAPMRTGLAPKRALLYRRADEAIDHGHLCRITVDGVQHTIEVPHQIVVEGIHPKTRKPYVWDERKKLSSLTPVTWADIERFLAAMEIEFDADLVRAGQLDADRAAPPIDTLRCPDYRLDWLADLVRRTPNTAEHFSHRDSMREMVWAIQGAFSDDEQDRGYELALEWAEKWPDFSEAHFEGIWRYPSQTLGVQRLLRILDSALPSQDGVSWEARMWFEPIEAVTDPFGELHAGSDATQDRFKVIDLAEIDDATHFTVDYLVKGVLPREGLSVLYGQSGTGKTFVAFDIAHSIASGREWAGRRTTRSHVLYVAAEGSQGIPRRLMALQRTFLDRPLEQRSFELISEPVDFLSSDDDLRKLVANAEETHAELIIIDTLSRVFAGGDENSSVDMGKFVKRLERLQKQTGAHVLVVHHSGKDESRGARGHSLLRAALDTEIEVTGGAIQVSKQRDMDDSFKVFFKLRPVRLGFDQDGDPVTSCVVDLRTEPEPPSISNLSAVQREVMDLALAVGSGGARFTFADLVAAKPEYSTLTYDRIRSAARELEKKRLVDRLSAGAFKIPGKIALPGAVPDGDGPGNVGHTSGKQAHE